MLAAILPLLATAAALPMVERYVPSSAQNVTIHPNGHMDKCLTVAGPIQDNAVVNIQDCNLETNAHWLIVPGSTYIKQANSELCLDAGFTNGFDAQNGLRTKLSPCPGPNWPSPYDSPSGTKWNWMNGNTFQLVALEYCLDNADGGLCNGNPVQIWQCHNGAGADAPNQLWTVQQH